MKVYIYYLSSSDNPYNIRYVGKAKDLKYRLQKHRDSHRLKVRNDYKNNWMRKVLSEGHKIIISELDYVPEEEWRFWEVHWISLIKSWGFKLTNSDIGGYGSDMTQETKRKISLKTTGKKRTPEQCLKISLATKGRKCSIDELSKRTGKPRSDETKKKISLNHARSNAKRVDMLTNDGDIVATFESMSEALFTLKRSSISPIQRVCDGIAHTAYGYKWRWSIKKEA